MQHVDRTIGVAAVALGAVALAACSAAPVTPVELTAASSGAPENTLILASFPPPAKRAEIPPAAPSPQTLWDGGHWNWNGARYIWTPGRYIERPQPDANWIPGYWQREAGGWAWTEGRWKS